MSCHVSVSLCEYLPCHDIWCTLFLTCRVDDRIVSVNGISLEGATHSTAIQSLRSAGGAAHLVSVSRSSGAHCWWPLLVTACWLDDTVLRCGGCRLADVDAVAISFRPVGCGLRMAPAECQR